MRPEYIDAVATAQSGILGWIALILPTLIAAYAAYSRRFLIVFFLAACAAFWLLLAAHDDRVREAKERHAQTEQELRDARGHRRFDALAYSAMFTPIVVGIQFAAVYGAFWVFRWIRRFSSKVVPSAEPQ